MITIVDYGAGNIGSVEKAFQYLGQQVRLATTAKEVEEADVLVLPGVGAIGDAMENLTKGGLAEAVVAHIKQNKPFLGICLGLQMLFEESEEGGLVKGLGVFPGKVCKFSDDMGLKIPQIGWNQLLMKEDSRLFNLTGCHATTGHGQVTVRCSNFYIALSGSNDRVFFESDSFIFHRDIPGGIDVCRSSFL